MTKRVSVILGAILGLLAGCAGSDPGSGTPGAGGSGAAGSAAAAGSNGAAGSGGTTGAAGTSSVGAAGSNGASGTGAAGTSAAGTSGGAAGTTSAAGTNGAAGAGTAGTSGGAGTGATAGAGPSFVPTDYKGTPFKPGMPLTIPGRINAADYDRGGAGVGYCHSTGNCGGGTVTGDYPSGAGVYRPPIPATAKICSGAACDDNVGVCRMNPSKPDKVNATTQAPAGDTYLCYTQASTWTKYTIVVGQAGAYAVGGFMAVPQGGAVNLSFGSTITTGNLTLVETNPSACGGGEFYHCWAQRENLATVTFPSAGTYVMTLTQVGRFNADNFTFTKM